MITVVHRDRLYIPRHAVDMTALREHFEIKHQTKAQCSPTCPMAQKVGRFCSTCPGRDARIRLWTPVTTAGGVRLIAVAGGSTVTLRHVVVGAYRVVDRRADVPFRNDLRWTGKLRTGLIVNGRGTADQKGMLQSWRAALRRGETGGVVISPPRSGKCVLPSTMIRTRDGYHHISRLFGTRDARRGVEEIGNFGVVAAPGGTREIRGLYAKVVDVVINVDLQGGAHIGGSEAHPIRVMDEDDQQQWVRLADLTGRERVVIARDAHDPVPHGQGLTDEQATLVGTVLRCADYARLSTGVLHLSRTTLRENPALDVMLRGICRVQPAGDLMTDMGRLPILGEWPNLLMRSTHAAWHAFARSAAMEEADVVSFRVPDRDVARALHMHLLGQGVMSALTTPTGDGPHHVDVVDLDAWENYLDHVPVEGTLVMPITEVRRVLRPHVVMDIRVPNGRAFHGNGLVLHNTVIGVAATLSERSRTFITATKIDFLRQFGKRFGELTNLRRLYAQGRRPVVLVDPAGWPDGPQYGVHVVKRWNADAQRADVVMSSAQQFLDTTRGNERMREYLIGRFGTLIGDEIHQGAAAMFSDLINRSDARRKLGLTATIQRKDGLSDIVLKTLGPVVAKGNSASDLPMIEVLETGVGVGRNYSNWNAMTKFLINMEERNRIILRQVFVDLRADPRHSIVITTTRRDHIATLVKMINANALYCNQARDEDWPHDLAVAYLGGTDTNQVLNMAGKGRTRVVVAMVSMVQLGLDIMRWTHVYVGVVPTSNPYNVYQLINRVCTPYPPELEAEIGRKPQSVARICVDALSASVFSFAKLFKNGEYGFEAGLTSRNYVGVPLYRMTPEQYRRAAEIAKHPKAYSPEDAGVEVTLGKTRTGKTRRKLAWKAKRDGITSF